MAFKLTRFLSELNESGDPLFSKVPILRDHVTKEPIKLEDGKLILTLCAYCPAAKWAVVHSSQTQIAHLSYFCSMKSMEYVAKDMEYIDGCDGYYDAVEEQELQDKLLKED